MTKILPYFWVIVLTIKLTGKQQRVVHVATNGRGSQNPKSLLIIIFIRLKISTSIQKISEAGCQRGTNTHQRWPPLQLSDICHSFFTVDDCPLHGGSEKNRFWCAATGISEKQRHSKCSKWPFSAWIYASNLFRHWSSASSTTLFWYYIQLYFTIVYGSLTQKR